MFVYLFIVHNALVLDSTYAALQVGSTPFHPSYVLFLRELPRMYNAMSCRIIWGVMPPM